MTSARISIRLGVDIDAREEQCLRSKGLDLGTWSFEGGSSSVLAHFSVAEGESERDARDRALKTATEAALACGIEGIQPTVVEPPH